MPRHTNPRRSSSSRPRVEGWNRQQQRDRRRAKLASDKQHRVERSVRTAR